MKVVFSGKNVPKILIADDNRKLRESLFVAFKRMGFEIYLASGGTRAVTIAKRQPIDLVILDVNMPDLDGIEALVRIRQLRSSVGCIFITSEPPRDVEEKAGRLGSYRLVKKPFRIDSLRNTALDLLNFGDYLTAGGSGDKVSSSQKNSGCEESNRSFWGKG